MDAQLEAELIECLEALAQGESIERILARYPQEAAQLRPLLETAAALPALRMEPSEAAKMQSRQKFMAQSNLLRATPRKTMGFLPRFATGFLAAAVVAIALGTGAVAASGSALPGDPLYSLKRTVEDVRLQSASSPTVRQGLQHEFEQRRRDETNNLLNAGRAGDVDFTGTIEVIQPRAWIVSGLVVQLNANTQIAGMPQINRVAEVHGVTSPQGLLASSISIESSAEPEVTPTPEATETLRVTDTPEPTETAVPATPVAPQPARTQQPTAAPRPAVTAQPTATPEPVEVEFTGGVNALSADMWNIDGTTIVVNQGTEIRGPINPGQRVKVKALRLADGQLVATRIELLEGGGDNSSNSNGNVNQNSNENQNGNNDNTNDNGSNSNHNSNDDGGNSNGNSNGGNDNGGDKSGNGN